MHPRRAFTLVELLATVAILAMLVTAALYFTASYTSYAQKQSDKQTLVVLNDALTRYKCEGGNVSALTPAVPIGSVLSSLRSTITWAGRGHQVLQAGVTYAAASLNATGTGAQYHFTRYNTYQADDYTPGSSNGPTLADGVGYMANGGWEGPLMWNQSVTAGYELWTSTTTGYIAYKDASDNVMVYTAGDWDKNDLPASPSYTFWSCVGPEGSDNGSNAVASGYITVFECDYNHLTSLDVSKLSELNQLEADHNPDLASVNISNIRGFNDSGWVYLINIPSITGSAESLNAFYHSLPVVTNAELDVNGNGDATGSDISIAIAKGWVVNANAPIISGMATYSGSGGITMSNNGAATYSLNVLSTTGFVGLQTDNGTLSIIQTGFTTVPACNSITLWSIDRTGAPSGDIQQLNIGNSQLSSINASNCTGLTNLTCSNNQLSSINLSGCTQLQQLNCGTNLLTSLSLTDLSSLQSLRCDNNQLTSLNVHGLSNLTYIYADYNAISSLDVSGALALNNLWLGWNPITTTSASINAIYSALPTVSGSSGMFISNNNSAIWGSTVSIAWGKNWQVYSED